MKRISRLAQRLMLVFLALVASSMMFLSSPANAATFVDENNFETEVLKSDVPVIVVFGAVWSGSNRVLAPIIDQIAIDYQGKAKAVQVDIDNAPEISRKYSIQSLPTTIVFNKGEKTGQYSGLITREKILQLAGLA